MKKTVLGGMLLATVASVGLWSCTDGIGTGFDHADGTGKISLNADLDPTVVTKANSRAEYNQVGVSDLSIRLVSADGQTSGPWSVNDFQSEERRFNVGYYTLEAFYGTSGEEGFEKPYFYGKAEQVSVQDDQTTTVSVVASVCNSAVSVRYTDAFKEYMTSWSAMVKNIEVGATETRPVYVNPGEVVVDVQFVKANGKGAKMEVKRFNAEAAHYYTLTVDVTNENGLVEGITVTLDEEVAEEDVIINISDEVLSAPAPEITANGFIEGETLAFFAGQNFDTAIGYNVLARGGIRSIELTTESNALIARGWPESIDLIKADAETQSELENMGLKTLGVFHNPEKMAIINLEGVLSKIPYSDKSNIHTFTLNVTDAIGNQAEPMMLKVEVQKVKLSLANAVHYANSNEMTVELSYNGGDPNDIIEIRKMTASGGSGALLSTTYEKIGTNLYGAKCVGDALKTGDVIIIYARSKEDTSITSAVLAVPAISDPEAAS